MCEKMAPQCFSSAWTGRVNTCSDGHCALLRSQKNHFEPDLIIDSHFKKVLCLLMLSDLLIAIAVIQNVPYTEIDWRAYMQEVEGVIRRHELDYELLQGDTGPLVYPAGFVYLYSVLYWITDRGQNIRTAQYVFAILHSGVVGLAACIYRRCWLDSDVSAGRRYMPLATIFVLPLSRRVLSIFVLRLFNDGPQQLFLFAAILSFTFNRWILGCLLYSLSVSVKMNALLYAPAVALLLCQSKGPFVALSILLHACLLPQVFLGMPFLLYAPKAYVERAFQFGRVFTHKWSVNGAFLTESMFTDIRLTVILLVLHLATVIVFGQFRWTDPVAGGLVGVLQAPKPPNGSRSPWSLVAFRPNRRLRPSHVVLTMFACNVIGITFCRTLHYQFYAWYFYTLPLLLLLSPIPRLLSIVIVVAVEIVFNVFPPHWMAALTLQICHLTLVFAMWRLPCPASKQIYDAKHCE